MKKFWFEGDRRTFIYHLLKNWHNILTRYEEETHDLPYYYIEPTNIGFLSLAAYKSKAISIEEFSASRGKGAERYLGRADLWIQSQNGTTYDIEGKKDWITLSSKNVVTKINNLLVNATKDIKKLTDKSDCSIAVAFLIPHYPQREKPDWKSFKRQVLSIEFHKGDFAAIHICDEKTVKDKDNKIDGKLYPGIAVVGKYV
ncbi:MAG: hypothetical protein A2W05_07335 [Candidatus Schekmanbacteria bacterium RBG_16_38_10]|uniref:Uncharacterized protein n=1 Tax=Candidatus Schekmanbacteria bacterium RBG_16_38_10 TaxID=1817879 RepID=A0A1F7S0T4_9BACT|nr:MAG: hypothetical protein A2W05_07335 [Candidatus Schekmanbacteria bacterium RBG_16_38_10]